MKYQFYCITKKTDFAFREQASIFSRLGFDGLFFGRLDWRDKDTRIQNQTMEVIWKGIDNKTVWNMLSRHF